MASSAEAFVVASLRDCAEQQAHQLVRTKLRGREVPLAPPRATTRRRKRKRAAPAATRAPAAVAFKARLPPVDEAQASEQAAAWGAYAATAMASHAADPSAARARAMQRLDRHVTRARSEHTPARTHATAARSSDAQLA